MNTAASTTFNDTHNRWGSRLFYVDLRTLAVFRMAIAAVICGDMIERLINVRFYYTEQGLLPRAAIDELFGNSIRWTSLHYHTGGSVALQSTMLLISLALAVALFVGYRTRIVTLLSWILFISLNRRVSSMCTGGDDLLRLMLLWSVFLPLGARWSLDASRNPGSSGESNRFFSMGSVAILLQLTYVYFFTAIIKLAGPAWIDGSAVQQALQYEVHVRATGLKLSQASSFLVLVTYATLIAELIVPFLVFSPIRNGWARGIGLMTMIAFHLGIVICLRIGTFPFVCMACWLIFIPTEFWDWWQPRTQQRTTSGVATSGFACEHSKLVAGIVTIMLLFVTVYNVLGLVQLNRLGIGVPNIMRKVAKLSRLDQNWKMYAPHPASTDGWFLMPCELSNGQTFDIYRGTPVDYAKPQVISADFPSVRVKKLFLDHRDQKESPLWASTLRYYTREWNRKHPDRQVVRAQFTFAYELEHGGQPQAFPYYEYHPADESLATLKGIQLIDLVQPKQ